MSAQHVIDVVLGRVYAPEAKDGFVRTVAWSNEVLDVTDKHVEVRTTKFEAQRVQ